MKFLFKIITFALLVAFLAVGYWRSDDYFFGKLIAANNIKTPEEASKYVASHITWSDLNSTGGFTPRYLLTKKQHLYCDEGAIVLATIVHKLGFKTRLTDISIPNSVTQHTILEVYENGHWKTYDTVQNLEGLAYHPLIDLYEQDFWRRDKFSNPPQATCKDPENHKRMLVRYRKYPQVYNWLLQNNCFIQKLVLKLRGIPN